jgi:hypothetical protein
LIFAVPPAILLGSFPINPFANIGRAISKSRAAGLAARQTGDHLLIYESYILQVQIYLMLPHSFGGNGLLQFQQFFRLILPLMLRTTLCLSQNLLIFHFKNSRNFVKEAYES